MMVHGVRKEEASAHLFNIESALALLLPTADDTLMEAFSAAGSLRGRRGGAHGGPGLRAALPGQKFPGHHVRRGAAHGALHSPRFYRN